MLTLYWQELKQFVQRAALLFYVLCLTLATPVYNIIVNNSNNNNNNNKISHVRHQLEKENTDLKTIFDSDKDGNQIYSAL